MAAYESLNDQQMRDYLEMLKTVHGIEFHPEGSMTLPTGHRVAAKASLYREDGHPTQLHANLFPETGALHVFTMFPEDSHQMLLSPMDIQTRSGNLKGVTSLNTYMDEALLDEDEDIYPERAHRMAPLTKENVSEMLSGSSQQNRPYSQEEVVDTLKQARKNRGMITVSESISGGSPRERMFNLREQRFED